MLMDILMEALMNMDDETLDSVLESCDAEELDIISDAMEMKIADRKNSAVQSYHLLMNDIRNGNDSMYEYNNGDHLHTEAHPHFNTSVVSTFTPSMIRKSTTTLVDPKKVDKKAKDSVKEIIRLNARREALNKFLPKTKKLYEFKFRNR